MGRGEELGKFSPPFLVFETLWGTGHSHPIFPTTSLHNALETGPGCFSLVLVKVSVHVETGGRGGPRLVASEPELLGSGILGLRFGPGSRAWSECGCWHPHRAIELLFTGPLAPVFLGFLNRSLFALPGDGCVGHCQQGMTVPGGQKSLANTRSPAIG